MGHTKESLDTRGVANPIIAWFCKVILEDFAIKTAIGTAVATTVWVDRATNAAAQLAKYGSAMLVAPGKKFIGLYKRIRSINKGDEAHIREILCNHEITIEEKLRLLLIKCKSVLKKLKGEKRKQFILFIIATILFSVGGNFVEFAWFMDRLRAVIGTNSDTDSIREHVIEAYYEYNAPIPKEFANMLPEEIVKALQNVK